MNKSQLVEKVASKSGLSIKDSGAAVNALIEVVKETLAAGDTVALTGFGSFLVRDRAARIGRNPRTNEIVEIPAVKVPSFKAGKPLKDAVNH